MAFDNGVSPPHTSLPQEEEDPLYDKLERPGKNPDWDITKLVTV
jgi:hypothetical protein